VPQLCDDNNPCTIDSCIVSGPIGGHTAECKYTTIAPGTPCGPNGLQCTNGVCQ
jgi:hypothetical protein